MAPLLNGRYELRGPLGTGGFGVVQQFLDTLTGNLVAVKTIMSKSVNAESLRLLREIDVLLQLSNRHPRVVSVYDIFCTPSSSRLAQFGDDGEDSPARGGGPTDSPPPFEDPVGASSPAGPLPRVGSSSPLGGPTVHANMDFDVHIVMPLMRGDLHTFTKEIKSPDFLNIPQRDEFERAVCVVFAFHMLFGLDFVHKCGIVHRDLKPENILTNLNATSPYESVAMIADFGLARDARCPETFYVCTRHYRPPEVITNSASSSSTAIDIWSVGCILFELVTSKFLLRLQTSLNEAGHWEPAKASFQLEAILDVIGSPTAEDVEKYVDKSKHANIRSYLLKSRARQSRVAELLKKYWRVKGVPPEEQNLWIDLICSCMKYFPQQRPTAEQLCCHPLFQRYGVFYGQTLRQELVTAYVPVVTSNVAQENKAKILELIANKAKETTAMRTISVSPPLEGTLVPLEGESAGAGEMARRAVAAVRPPSITLPLSITDPVIREKYGSCPISSSADVQDITNAVLHELSQEQDPQKTHQLQQVLTFLMALIPQQQQQHLGDAEDDYAKLEGE